MKRGQVESVSLNDGEGEHDEVARHPAEVAAYIANVTQGLTILAQEANLKFLAYLLDMARIEASELATKSDITAPKSN